MLPMGHAFGKATKICVAIITYVHEFRRLKTIRTRIVIDQAQFTVACMSYRTLSIFNFSVEYSVKPSTYFTYIR